MANKLTRRNFILGSTASALGMLADMRFIEPHWLRLEQVDIQTGKQLQRPIKLLHLSDLHASYHVSWEHIRSAIELGLSRKPDVACITGDFVSRRIPDINEYARVLSLLPANCPCYACVGNHDGGSWVGPRGGYRDLTEIEQLLRDAGVQLLFNESERFCLQGKYVEFVGLGDFWAGDSRPERAFPSNPSDNEALRIVLSHNPDSKELLRPYAWDLMLCGHTHGGQLSLPLLGTPFAPVVDHRFVYGLNRWEDRLIYTTSGVGNVSGMRFNCRPEVAVLSIT